MVACSMPSPVPPGQTPPGQGAGEADLVADAQADQDFGMTRSPAREITAAYTLSSWSYERINPRAGVAAPMKSSVVQVSRQKQ